MSAATESQRPDEPTKLLADFERAVRDLQCVRQIEPSRERRYESARNALAARLAALERERDELQVYALTTIVNLKTENEKLRAALTPLRRGGLMALDPEAEEPTP